jgi:hypothetical protein
MAGVGQSSAFVDRRRIGGSAPKTAICIRGVELAELAPSRHFVDDRERWVKLYAEVRKIYRESSPAAAKEMCRLALEAEDERVRSVCASMVMDRAWGKPKEYDPNAEAPKRAPPFDPSLYTVEELKRMQEVMLMIARRQGLMPEEEDEAVEPAVEESRDGRRFESSHIRGNRC